MGFTPRQIDEMSLWEIAACIDGYNKAHGTESAQKGLTPAEQAELVSAMDNVPLILR